MKKIFSCVLNWVKQHKFRAVSILVLALALAPQKVQTQLLPDPCCPILSAGLSTISELLKTVVGAPLAQIQKLQDEMNKYQREVIWPLEAINKAKQLAGLVSGMVSTIRGYIQMPVNSATLSQP